MSELPTNTAANSPAPAAALRELHAAADATFIPFGPEESDAAAKADSAGGQASVIELVDTYGAYEAEYAAIRKSAGLLDMPMMSLVRVKGSDAGDFLHRLLSNEVTSLPVGQCRRAFLLDTKGHILAELLVMHAKAGSGTEAPTYFYLECDRLSVPTVLAELDKYLFGEDVTLEDLTGQYHRFSLHGPTAATWLETVAAEEATPETFGGLKPLHHQKVTLDGHCCSAYRLDQTGTPGYHVWLPTEHAAGILQRLADAVGGLNPQAGLAERIEKEMRGEDARGGKTGGDQASRVAAPDSATGDRGYLDRAKLGKVRGRGIGWLAFNTARLEAGTPLFRVDFGPGSYPAETGLLDQTVSFTKGCYPGQEQVCMMRDRGHPSKVIVALSFEDNRLPIAGSAVYDAAAVDAKTVGGVTSSAVGPLCAGQAIALATVKWGKHQPGTELHVPAEGAKVKAVVREGLAAV